MRRRMLDPEFFSDPDLVANFDMTGRIFFAGLWCVAEDSWVFEPNMLGLKMKIFPGDNIDLPALDAYYKKFVSMNRIIEFQIGDRTYAWIKNCVKRQKVDHPSAPSLPLPPWVQWQEANEESRRKAKYVFSTVPDQYLSRTSPGQVPDKSPLIEVKLSKVNLSEVNLSELKDPPAPAALYVIFTNWFNEEFNTKHMPDTYKDKINTRLKTYTIEQLQQAALAMKRDPHMMGQNDRKRVYATLEYITRNDTNVDKFLNLKQGEETHGATADQQTNKPSGPGGEIERLAEIRRVQGLAENIGDTECDY